MSDLIKRLRHADTPGAKPSVLDVLTSEAADLIEQQAARIAQFERILDGLPEDAIDGGWTALGMSKYAKGLETRIAELEALATTIDKSMVKRLAIQHGIIGDAAGKDSVDAVAFMKFAGAVLEAHRNDGSPTDLDGGFLQEAAVAFGMIEEREVTEPCCEGNCTCAELWTEFPVQCYFLTDAGRAAIASLTKTADGEKQS